MFEYKHTIVLARSILNYHKLSRIQLATPSYCQQTNVPQTHYSLHMYVKIQPCPMGGHSSANSASAKYVGPHHTHRHILV